VVEASEFGASELYSLVLEYSDKRMRNLLENHSENAT